MYVLKELYTVQYLTSVFDFYVDPKEKIETMIGKNTVFRLILQIKIDRENCQTTT